jgi:hypothetical protein
MGDTRVNKEQLQEQLRKSYHYTAYTYERFSNGSCEYLIYPYERGREMAGAPMRYRFNSEGERI